MDVIQAQREARELMVNTQYILKNKDEQLFDDFQPAWGKMRVIAARKQQHCSTCKEAIPYMAPMSVFLAISEEDGHFHRQNMCASCIVTQRRKTSEFILKQVDGPSYSDDFILDQTHLRHMTIDQATNIAAQMRKDAIYIREHISMNIIARDGLYLYETIMATTSKTKHYCHRCSAIVPPEETTFSIPTKQKHLHRAEYQYLCQTCATKSIRASQKRIDQYKREQKL
ncbi:hypothetical protein [Kurthia senegalensis]|uniref:hypothetical protein n=1 Tax=Kurthia senegalensis TaxID=1033740 RepID=UPI00028A033F|nr:hypothetical protein [Kurthia senegalensis]